MIYVRNACLLVLLWVGVGLVVGVTVPPGTGLFLIALVILAGGGLAWADDG